MVAAVDTSATRNRHLEEAAHSHPNLQAVREIADILRRYASHARDGNICWRHPVQPVGNLLPGFIGPHLYPGTLGIALFLAAAARVLEAEDLRALCLHALLPLRREIHELAADPVRARNIAHPIGGLTGLGSLVYGFTRIGDLLNDPSLHEDAHTVTVLITPERISSDDLFDVMLGSAGALLGLLALAERRPDKNGNGLTPLDLAYACGSHLMERRCTNREGAAFWPTRSGDPNPSGFCHGSAGIVSSLLRLHEKIDDPGLKETAEQGLAYERALYVPSAGNWQISAVGEPRFANSWCKGAPGIALGRLSLLGFTGDPFVTEEISIALERTRSAPLSATDDLCCGNAGRMDILLQASCKLGDPAWSNAAHDLADCVLERAQRNGCYSLELHGQTLLDLRFFPGLSGIGYALLRLSAPDVIPCVTAME